MSLLGAFRALLICTVLLYAKLPPTEGNRYLTLWGARLRNLLGIPSELPPPKFLKTDSGHEHSSRISHQRPDSDDASAIKARCALVRGTWCRDFHTQTKVPSRPVPRGSKDCPNACSGWGNCNHDSGLCECPAGRGGPDCGQEVKRPCASGHRPPHEFENPVPVSSIGPDGLDKDPTKGGWTASRCFGFCWDDIAACFCGEGKLRRIPAPPGSPPWTPPLQWGRVMADSCQPMKTANGTPTFHPRSGLTYDAVYGPEGWCNKHDSLVQCNCFMEVAPPCDFSNPMETTCVSQCSGHGDCFFGYCRCHPGWYGADCSRKKAGLEMEPGLQESRPWLKDLAVMPPAALDPPRLTARPRPLIYVYDIPPEYTSRMLQYRVFGDTCVWRRFHEGNGTQTTGWTYSIEMLLHELMLQSEHRTFDPEEADFFYVPLYVTCYFWPIMGWADTPWWYAPNGLRVMHGANMITELHEWLRSTHPWWDRRGGRDHIWLMAHDEGACWMPKAVYDTSIVLTHWGRMDAAHVSATAFAQDNYSGGVDPVYNSWRGVDFKDRIRGHPCYDPKKDLVIPAFKAPSHFRFSPLLGGPPLERDILLFFRGDLGMHRLSHYSRGIRQKLFSLSTLHSWYDKYNIVLATGAMAMGEYSEQLARSKFCLVAPGDGWSPRAEDAVLHGCVPLVVMDEVHAVWEGILDWESFSVRIRESALEAVPEILTAVPPERLAKMQRNLVRVWHRFAYTSLPFLQHKVEQELQSNRQRQQEVRQRQAQAQGPRQDQAEVSAHSQGGADGAAAGSSSASSSSFGDGGPAENRTVGSPGLESPFRAAESFNYNEDAFATIMQWLHSRIPYTRGDLTR